MRANRIVIPSRRGTGNEVPALLLAEEQVHDPAPADVGAVTPAVVQDGLDRAAGFLEGIGEDGKAVEGTVFVDGAGELRDGSGVPGEPGGANGGNAVRIAQDVAKQVALVGFFLHRLLWG
jgi:hypothetical protein